MVTEEDKKIWTVENPTEKAFLNKKAKLFDFSACSKKEVSDLVLLMRRIMVRHHGIGLAAPQIGLDTQVFVAQLPSENGKGYTGKFYAIFNPTITSIAKKTIPDQEGCLSIPGYTGTVERAEKITVSGFDKNRRSITIKADGFLARIFQHEIDHLNGTLFTKKSADLRKIESYE